MTHLCKGIKEDIDEGKDIQGYQGFYVYNRMKIEEFYKTRMDLRRKLFSEYSAQLEYILKKYDEIFKCLQIMITVDNENWWRFNNHKVRPEYLESIKKKNTELTLEQLKQIYHDYGVVVDDRIRDYATRCEVSKILTDKLNRDVMSVVMGYL